MGYDIVYGNAEHFNLNRKFDIIFSGDLIEHLYNTGDFLECVRSHMGPESRLILVTPNPYRYGRIEDIVLRGYVRNHVDHTCWFDPVTLTQLLNFYNFEVEDIYWTGYTKRMTHYLGFGFLNRLSFKGILALDFMIIAKLESK
jgi:2-polyprenyl-3-methyl-5-hydroxy-6-metoxy-1,4-benzoquinol methylase